MVIDNKTSNKQKYENRYFVPPRDYKFTKKWYQVAGNWFLVFNVVALFIAIYMVGFIEGFWS